MYHPALKTLLCDMLGIEYPILQAGIRFVARGPLAGAVSAAGGLGCIGAGTMNAGELRAEITMKNASAAIHAVEPPSFELPIIRALNRCAGPGP